MQRTVTIRLPSAITMRGVSGILTTLLAESPQPLTTLLTGLAGEPPAIKITGHGQRALDGGEAARLHATPGTPCSWRTGLLIAAGTAAARTGLAWLPARWPPGAVEALESGMPAGAVLPGAVREDRRAMCCTGMRAADGTEIAVESSAVLTWKGDRMAVAYEQVLAGFVASLPAGVLSV